MADNGVIPAPESKQAKYGLLSVASVIDESDDTHWPYGFEAETESCNYSATLIPICDPAQDPIEIIDASGPSSYEIKPFAIEVTDECLSVGMLKEDRKARVFRKLEAVTQLAIEREFSRGEYAAELQGAEARYLAAETAVVLADGPVPAKLGVALLERALAECGAGATGVIHLPRDVAAMVGDYYEVEDGHIETKFGNLVSAGSGYTGAAPGDVARVDELKPWIYATGPVVVRLGKPQLQTATLNDAFNAKTNETNWVAARSAAVWWDGCCHFAIQVDLTGAADPSTVDVTFP